MYFIFFSDFRQFLKEVYKIPEEVEDFEPEIKTENEDVGLSGIPIEKDIIETEANLENESESETDGMESSENGNNVMETVETEFTNVTDADNLSTNNNENDVRNIVENNIKTETGDVEFSIRIDVVEVNKLDVIKSVNDECNKNGIENSLNITRNDYKTIIIPSHDCDVIETNTNAESKNEDDQTNIEHNADKYESKRNDEEFITDDGPENEEDLMDTSVVEHLSDDSNDPDQETQGHPGVKSDLVPARLSSCSEDSEISELDMRRGKIHDQDQKDTNASSSEDYGKTETSAKSAGYYFENNSDPDNQLEATFEKALTTDRIRKLGTNVMPDPKQLMRKSTPNNSADEFKQSSCESDHDEGYTDPKSQMIILHKRTSQDSILSQSTTFSSELKYLTEDVNKSEFSSNDDVPLPSDCSRRLSSETSTSSASSVEWIHARQRSYSSIVHRTDDKPNDVAITNGSTKPGHFNVDKTKALHRPTLERSSSSCSYGYHYGVSRQISYERLHPLRSRSPITSMYPVTRIDDEYINNCLNGKFKKLENQQTKVSNESKRRPVRKSVWRMLIESQEHDKELQYQGNEKRLASDGSETDDNDTTPSRYVSKSMAPMARVMLSMSALSRHAKPSPSISRLIEKQRFPVAVAKLQRNEPRPRSKSMTTRKSVISLELPMNSEYKPNIKRTSPLTRLPDKPKMSPIFGYR